MYHIMDQLLEEGVIEPSSSAWSSPVVMHLKSDGTHRPCIDFRKINELTKKDAYPLPNMNEILSKLRNARYISTLDLSQAYFQVPLDKNSKEYTAFTISGRGLYQFTRLPFGLSNSPATFQRLMDGIITPEMDGREYCYLDDIVIVSKTFEEHLHWLRIVIMRVKQANLTMNRAKSVFGCTEVKYLGFIVNFNGLQPDLGKIEAITNYPIPKNLRGLRRFNGMASWYRRFIDNYAKISEPLNQLEQALEMGRGTAEGNGYIEGEANHSSYPSLPRFFAAFLFPNRRMFDRSRRGTDASARWPRANNSLREPESE